MKSNLVYISTIPNPISTRICRWMSKWEGKVSWRNASTVAALKLRLLGASYHPLNGRVLIHKGLIISRKISLQLLMVFFKFVTHLFVFL